MDNITVQIRFKTGGKIYSFSSKKKYRKGLMVVVKHIDGTKGKGRVVDSFVDNKVYEGKVLHFLSKKVNRVVKHIALNRRYKISNEAYTKYFQYTGFNCSLDVATSEINDLILGLTTGKGLYPDEYGTLKVCVNDFIFLIKVNGSEIIDVGINKNFNRKTSQAQQAIREANNYRHIYYKAEKKIINISQTVQHYYKKEIADIDCETIKSKIMRNIMLSEKKVYTLDSDDCVLLKYGNLNIFYNKKYELVYKIKESKKSPDNWVKNIDKFNRLNERFGIEG